MSLVRILGLRLSNRIARAMAALYIPEASNDIISNTSSYDHKRPITFLQCSLRDLLREPVHL
jgi:hypothetical protein